MGLELVAAGLLLLHPHFPRRVLGFRAASLGLALCSGPLAGEGWVHPVESLVCRVGARELWALPAYSSQALCLSFSICECGWTLVYPGATSCSWWRNQITVTKAPSGAATLRPHPFPP